MTDRMLLVVVSTAAAAGFLGGVIAMGLFMECEMDRALRRVRRTRQRRLRG